MKKILIILFTFQVIHAQSLDTLDLFTCISSTSKNYPASNQKDLYNDIYLLKKQNSNSKWLPNLNLEGKASYQSDVVTINIDENMSRYITLPIPPHDNYNLFVDVNQMIYDGGLSKHTKQYENAQLNSRINEIDVQLYQINEQIETIYFAILLSEKNISLVNEIINELETRKKQIESGIKNGTLSPADSDMIQSQIIITELSLEEIKIQRSSLINVLANFTKLNINSNTHFSFPNINLVNNNTTNRPEKLLFASSRETLASAQKVLTAKKLPKAYAFSRVGYGKPGLNMLGTEFDSYLIAGVGFSWNIVDWKYTKREKEILYVQTKIIDSKEESFNKNIDISLEYNHAEKIRLLNSIEKQEELISLTQNILNHSKSQLDNGLITTTDYITQVNNDLKAKIELENKKIKLMQNNIEYLQITGQLYSLIEN